MYVSVFPKDSALAATPLYSAQEFISGGQPDQGPINQGRGCCCKRRKAVVADLCTYSAVQVHSLCFAQKLILNNMSDQWQHSGISRLTQPVDQCKDNPPALSTSRIKNETKRVSLIQARRNEKHASNGRGGQATANKNIVCLCRLGGGKERLAPDGV
ncbi:hypothetical protein V491_03947, partial [Pseudogymnoascus sp. VKM F-3775]